MNVRTLTSEGKSILDTVIRILDNNPDVRVENVIKSLEKYSVILDAVSVFHWQVNCRHTDIVDKACLLLEP